MPNSKREQHCNKKPFPDMEAAAIALSKWTRDRKRKDDPLITHMHAYKCQYCPKWHIGRASLRGINWNAVDQHEKKMRERIEQTRKENATRETVPG